jgi:hypothetical protein
MTVSLCGGPASHGDPQISLRSDSFGADRSSPDPSREAINLPDMSRFSIRGPGPRREPPFPSLALRGAGGVRRGGGSNCPSGISTGRAPAPKEPAPRVALQTFGVGGNPATGRSPSRPAKRNRPPPQSRRRPRQRHPRVPVRAGRDQSVGAKAGEQVTPFAGAGNPPARRRRHMIGQSQREGNTHA